MADGLASLQLIELCRRGDAPGWFLESFCERDFAARGIVGPFVQDNHTLSHHHRALPDLRHQGTPHVPAKLVRRVRGHIFDGAVDLRANPSCARKCGVTFPTESGNPPCNPADFADGVSPLQPANDDACDACAPYDRPSERGVRQAESLLSRNSNLPYLGQQLAAA